MKATLIMFGVAAALIVYYVGSCWWFPLANCWCCSGSGRHSRKDGKVFRDCRICAGRGRRFRIGRKIWNHFHRVSANR